MQTGSSSLSWVGSSAMPGAGVTSGRARDGETGEAVSVPAALDGRALLKLFHRYHFLALPVVDENKTLLRVLTQEDALQFAEEDADEEMLRFTRISGGDEFRDMGLLRRSRRRLSWLSVNILLTVAAASLIARYEDTLRSVIALAVFLPIISDMSGCSGNQAVAVSIRELSLERIRPGRYLWVLGKELSVGLLNGLVLGLLIGVVASLGRGHLGLGLLVGGTLWVNTIIAVTVGGLVRLLLKRHGLDPALSSSPILTTLTDSSGFLITLGLAAQFVDHLA